MHVRKTLLTLLLVTTTLNAQTAPGTAGTASTLAGASEDGREKAIELSPFVITSDQDTGYLASSTLAGTTNTATSSLRACSRNRMQTRPTTMISSTSVCLSVSTERWIRPERS